MLRLVGLVATFVVALLAAVVAVIGFRVTPLSAPFCALLAILATAVALWSARRGGSRDPLLIAFFTAAMLLVLVARSVALFFFAPIVAAAMDGNIVPDFPLVNKSFNLSYACADR